MNNFDIIMIAVAVAFILRIVKSKKETEARGENSEQAKETKAFDFKGFLQPKSNTDVSNRTTSTIRINEEKKTIKKTPTFQSLAQANTKKESRNGESTTDYVARKLHEADVVRKKDEWEVRREEQRNSGNLRMAKRLTEGEAIPPGNKIVICSYCGAENMVPKVSTEKHYCYFCRTNLARN